MKRPSSKHGSARKRPSVKKESADMKVYIYHSPITKCTICKCPLQLRTDEKPIQCTILGSESVEIILSYRKVCHTRIVGPLTEAILHTMTAPR